jgi:hypothetical protein
MNKFKVGDRARAYGTDIASDVEALTVTAVKDRGFMMVKTKCGQSMEVHYKQCRKLKEKTPFKTLWILDCDGTPGLMNYGTEEAAKNAFSTNGERHGKITVYEWKRVKK